MYNNPVVADFKTQFFRDFPYGTDMNTSVLDQDIANAFVTTNANINQGLFGTQGEYTLAYMYLCAHYLVTSLRASSQGINGQYNFLQQSKGVGGVSESFSIPPRISENPVFAPYCKSHYGAQYLFMVLPKLIGQMGTAAGTTRA